MDYKSKYLKYKNKYANLKIKYLNNFNGINAVGGDFLNSGSFGCVYGPPLKCLDSSCTGNKCVNGVSKLMNKQNAEAELGLFDILGIDIIDPSNAYHIGKPHLCKPDITPEIIKQCNEKKVNIEDPHILIYENGGYDLNSLCHFIITIENEETMLRYINSMLKKLLNIAQGLSLFATRKICHFDIKDDNIVTGLDITYNINDLNINKFRLIDFGLGFNYSDENLRSKKIFNGINGRNKYHFIPNSVHRCCFDNFLIDALIKYHISGRDIKPSEYISDFIGNCYKYVIPGIEQSERYKQFFIFNSYSVSIITDVFSKFINEKISASPMKTLEYLLDRADTYQFGCLLYTLLEYTIVNVEQSLIIEKFLKEKYLLHYNPTLRPPSTELGRLYQELLDRLFPPMNNSISGNIITETKRKDFINTTNFVPNTNLFD
jgi:hypothetical protein